MEQQIKVSIITPSFNQGQFIEETIQSVLDQTYKNIEYILVDGGSTDNTMDIVNKYRDKIDIIIHEKDKGQSDAINKGFKLATGTLVGWINSDDFLYPYCVEEIVKMYNQDKTNSIYYGSTLNFINRTGEIFKTKTLAIEGINTLLNKNYDINQPGSFYNLEAVKSIGYVNEKIHYCMDLDLWLRLLHKGGIMQYKERPLAAFRVWEETKTTTGKRKFLKDIRTTLLNYNASRLSANIIKLRWYNMKAIAKSILTS